MKIVALLLAMVVGSSAMAATIHIGPPADFRSAMQNLHAGGTLIPDSGMCTLSSHFEITD